MLSIFAGVLIARLLGPEGKGVVSLMTSFSVVMASILSFSLESGLGYYLSRNKNNLRFLLFVAISSSFFLWGLSICILLLFKNILMGTILEGLVGYPYILIIIFICILISNRILAGLLQGLQFFKVLIIPRSVTSFVLVSSLVILYITGELSISKVLLIYAVVRSISLVVYISNLLKSTQTNHGSKSKRILKKVFTFSLKQHFGTIFREINYRLDYFILAYLLPVNQLGIYSVSVGLSELLWYIPMAIGITSFPRIAEAELKRSYSIAGQSVRLALIGSLLVGSLFFIIGPFIIKLFFGSKFIASIVPFLILLSGTIFMATSKVVLTCLSGLGKPIYQSINAFIVLFISVVLSLVFIQKYGIIGASIAKSIGYFISFILGMVWLRNTTKT